MARKIKFHGWEHIEGGNWSLVVSGITGSVCWDLLRQRPKPTDGKTVRHTVLPAGELPLPVEPSRSGYERAKEPGRN